MADHPQWQLLNVDVTILHQNVKYTVYIYALTSVYCGLQLPNKDLEERRSTQKVDPVTGVIYTKDIYDPEKPKPKKEVKYSTSVSVVTNTLHCACLLRRHL